MAVKECQCIIFGWCVKNGGRLTPASQLIIWATRGSESSRLGSPHRPGRSHQEHTPFHSERRWKGLGECENGTNEKQYHLQREVGIRRLNLVIEQVRC